MDCAGKAQRRQRFSTREPNPCPYGKVASRIPTNYGLKYTRYRHCPAT